MPVEFDHYATEYEKLLQDPIRDRFAPASRFFFERKLLLIRDFCRRHRIPTAAWRWLDVGCGQGELLRLGKPFFAEVIGCDPSLGMLANCASLNVRRQDQPDRVPFPDRSVDLATAVCVYHHVEPPARLALTREILRVVKPGGVFCVIEHNPFNPATQLIVRRTPVDATARLLTAGLTRRVLHAAGAVVLETKHFLYLPERFYGRLAGLEDALARVPLGGQYAVFARKP